MTDANDHTMTEPFSYVCKNHERDIPDLRRKIDGMSSGDNINLNGIERDIITAGLDLVMQLLTAERNDH